MMEPGSSAAERQVPSMPLAMLFDLDGTLVDTVALRVESWIVAFAEVGVETSAAELGSLIGLDGKRVAREVAERHGRPLSEHRVEMVDHRAGELFGQGNTHPARLPFVTELLNAVNAAGIPWAIATSSRPEQTIASVAALGLEVPPRVVDASHVTHAKPAPDLLLAGADQLGVPARDCWYVGDATWDMIAARSAMMIGTGVPSGLTDARTLYSAGAMLVVEHLGQLHQVLRAGGAVPA